MPDAPSRVVYWDSCVFLEAVNADKDALTQAHSVNIKTMLEEAEGGSLRIYTSLLTVVEVSHATSEKLAGKLDTKIESQISMLLSPESSPVVIVDFHEFIADAARRLSREVITKGWALKPTDAIHMATAQRWKVAEFHTYESALVKYGPLIGATVCEPEPRQPRLIGP